MSIWMLIAQNSYAAIYQLQKHPLLITLKERFEHPHGRLKAEALTTEHTGRSKSRGTSGKHGMSQQVSMSEAERTKFIHQLSHHLDQRYEQHQFQRVDSYLSSPISG